jgi:hypothetical protein
MSKFGGYCNTFDPLLGRSVAIFVDEAAKTVKLVPESDPHYKECFTCGYSFDGFVKPAQPVEDAKSRFSDLYLAGAWHPDWPPMAMDGSVRA